MPEPVGNFFRQLNFNLWFNFEITNSLHSIKTTLLYYKSSQTLQYSLDYLHKIVEVKVKFCFFGHSKTLFAFLNVTNIRHFGVTFNVLKWF